MPYYFLTVCLTWIIAPLPVLIIARIKHII